VTIAHAKVDTLADFTGTVTVWGSDGITATGNATDLVRPSDWNSVHSLNFALGGNTQGNSTFGGTDAAFYGGRNITVAGNGTAMSVIGPDLAAYLTTAMASNRGTDFVQANAVFAGTNASGTVASNGLSVSVGNYITTARNSTDGIGLATAGSNMTWTANSAGLSIDARGYAGTGTTFGGTNVSASATLNSAGLNLSLSAPAAGLSNINVSAGTTSNNLSAIRFANANKMSFGLNGSTLTASFDPINIGMSTNGNTAGTTGTFDGAGLQYILVGGNNITLNQSSNGSRVSLSIVGANAPAFSGSNGSFTANTLTFGNLNGVSFYTSNGSIVASYTDAGGGGGSDGYNSAQFTNSTANSTMPILWAGNSNGSGNITLGLTGSTVTGSAPSGGGAFGAGMSNLGNTAGTSGTVGSNVVFVGSGEIALSQSVNGNSATVSIYEIPSYISFAENFTFANQSNFQRPTQSTFQIAPLKLDQDVSFDWIANLRSMSVGSTSFATTANTSFSYGQTETHRMVLYTKGTGANSLSLGSISSTAVGLSYSVQHTAGVNGSNYTMQHGMTYPISGGTSTYSTSYGVSNASIQISSTHMTVFAGAFMGLSDWAGTLGKGEYWIAYNQSTSAQTTVTNASGAGISLSYGGNIAFNASVRSQMGRVSNAASHGLWLFNGSASVGGGTAISSISMGQISQLASNVMAHVRLGRFL